MHDTIDMLEAIGKDASLRYADGETLASDAALDAASDALKMAILSGQRGELWAELGAQPMQAMQGVQMPQREEDPDQDEGDEPNPSPDSPDKT
ncbi:hypothetical protein ISP17_15280 [Dyella ginsengisoli]|uniref:Uncharacterized protein n=1 Tax=Dyella ginsengisoli TaxID=363848 RepID=A0ABW8JWA2_9GAMM